MTGAFGQVDQVDRYIPAYPLTPPPPQGEKRGGSWALTGFTVGCRPQGG
jgi:hypothetical protein